MEEQNLLSRDDRTLETYKEAGALMKVYKEIGRKLVVDLSKVLPATEVNKLMKAQDKIDVICSRAEDAMFHDHPYVDDTYTRVFYGNVSDRSSNAVDAEVREIAKRICYGMFRD